MPPPQKEYPVLGSIDYRSLNPGRIFRLACYRKGSLAKVPLPSNIAAFEPIDPNNAFRLVRTVPCHLHFIEVPPVPHSLSRNYWLTLSFIEDCPHSPLEAMDSLLTPEPLRDSFKTTWCGEVPLELGLLYPKRPPKHLWSHIKLTMMASHVETMWSSLGIPDFRDADCRHPYLNLICKRYLRGALRIAPYHSTSIYHLWYSL